MRGQRYRPPGHRLVGRQQRHDHDRNVPEGRIVQSEHRFVERQQRHDHEPDVLECNVVQSGLERLVRL